jgi:hypothetical protein
LNGKQGEQLLHLAGIRATQLIFARADLAHLFRVFPTEEGGVSIEFEKADWSFAVEVLPDGSLEIDASSESGEVFEAVKFAGFSRDFFESFDKMTAVALDEKN